MPEAARARVTQVVVASVPFLPNSAQSACGISPTSRSASSTSRSDGPFRQSPAAVWRATASATTGLPWPTTIGPQLHMKST